MANEIRVAIAGLGNCAAALIMGKEYYKQFPEDQAYINGLMNPKIGKYTYNDIKFVAAFDINKEKIGQDLSKAIFAKPNNLAQFISASQIPFMGVEVLPGPILDGCAPHMQTSFNVYDPDLIKPVDVAAKLREAKAEIFINFLPVGSYHASRYYAQAVLKESIPDFESGTPAPLIFNSEDTLSEPPPATATEKESALRKRYNPKTSETKGERHQHVDFSEETPEDQTKIAEIQKKLLAMWDKEK